MQVESVVKGLAEFSATGKFKQGMYVCLCVRDLLSSALLSISVWLDEFSTGFLCVMHVSAVFSVFFCDACVTGSLPLSLSLSCFLFFFDSLALSDSLTHSFPLFVYVCVCVCVHRCVANYG